MTVRAMPLNADRYIGLSSDTKPTPGIPGATFFETDTGNTYIYDGAWVLYGPSSINKLIMKKATTSLIRPDNTASYTAGDSICDAVSTQTPIVLTNIVSDEGKAIRATKILVRTDHTSIPAMNVWIAKSGLSMADNEVLSIADGDIDDIVGIVPLSDKYYTAANSIVLTANIAEDLICAADSKNLWVILEAAEAYTPAASQSFAIDVYYSELN